MLRITDTENGKVKGLPGTDARITVYKGIPFAADTSGENRWRPPQPVENWTGIRECFEFAPISMQEIPGEDPAAFYSKEWHVDPEIPMGEDSLALNIWTNAKTGTEKMPVLVWIFGGGLQVGYPREMEFDGERIASRGVVLVSIGYRLNIFGFLSHPDLTAENPDAPTNFGFLDQKAGIEWVKRNIAHFGGDPDNITIAGQSSGGVSVFSHLCSPQTKGLFQKAIVQSSAGGSVLSLYPKAKFNTPKPLEQAEQVGKDFLEKYLGVKTIAEARKLDAAFIRDRVVQAHQMFPHVIDGKYLEQDIDGYLFSGKMHKLPLMLGHTGDELPLSAEGDTPEQLQAWTEENYGPYAQQVQAFWKKTGSESLQQLKEASRINGNELCTRLIADEYASQGRTIYCYEFDPEIPGDDAGSFHSSDLWFTFETLMKCWRPFDGHHYDLARKMCNYWTNFARSGDPNGEDADGKAMPQWLPYTSESRRIIHLYDEIEMEPEALDEKMDLLVKANLKGYHERMGGK